MKEKKANINVEAEKSAHTKMLPFVCMGVLIVALAADNVYLHVKLNHHDSELQRQALVVQTHKEQIGDLSQWIAHASVQGRWNDGKKSIADWGRSIVEKFRKMDSKLNPQSEK